MQVTITIPLQVLAPPTVTTSELPVGYVDQPYTAQLSASGGVPPYTWSATGLPAGLAMDADGLISGTATVAFSGDVTVTLVDAGG